MSVNGTEGTSVNDADSVLDGSTNSVVVSGINGILADSVDCMLAGSTNSLSISGADSVSGNGESYKLSLMH